MHTCCYGCHISMERQLTNFVHCLQAAVDTGKLVLAAGLPFKKKRNVSFAANWRKENVSNEIKMFGHISKAFAAGPTCCKSSFLHYEQILSTADTALQCQKWSGWCVCLSETTWFFWLAWCIVNSHNNRWCTCTEVNSLILPPTINSTQVIAQFDYVAIAHWNKE